MMLMSEDWRSVGDEKMRRLNRLLLKAIRESLDFGEVIIRFIELNSSIRKDEFVYNPEAFAREMKKIFGNVALPDKIKQKPQPLCPRKRCFSSLLQ